MSKRVAIGSAELSDDVRKSIIQVRTFRRWICALVLLLADVAAFASAAAVFRWGNAVPTLLFLKGLLPFEGAVDLFYLLGGLFIIARYLLGDYTQRQLFWDGARQTTVSLLLTSVPCVLLSFIGAGFSATAILASWACVIIAVPLFRQAARWLLSKASLWQLPTALIGEGQRLRDAHALFRKSLSLGFDVRFIVSDAAVAKPSEGVAQIALLNPSHVVQRLSEAGCLKAVFASEMPFTPKTTGLINKLMSVGIDVGVVPELSELPMLGMTMNYAFGQDLLLLHFRNNLLRLPSRICKRVFDIAASSVLLLIALPFFVVIAWLIMKADGGSPFFLQPRVGRRGREFPCMKFRTMRVDAEEMLSRWKAENSPKYREYVESNFKLRDDPRTTPVGRWLRRTSLDELPQLINVLFGDMSLVGPRPLISREVGSYGAAIELYKQIRPGITGLWQISGRSETTFADRIACDAWYTRNWSFWYDLVILIKTAAVLTQRKGAY